MNLLQWTASCVALACAAATGGVRAQGLVFGISGKSANDVNFAAAWKGCADEARKHGDTCLQLSAGNTAQARLQDAAIVEALSRPLAGLAVSVTNSGYLAESSLTQAAQKKVPVITFDSDLEPQHGHLRRAYVGPDNIEFGGKLASAAQASHPRGGVVCLLSGNIKDPNLNQRLLGVRRALSGDPALPPGTRLSGQGGWREADRCPWYNEDDHQRAVKQMVMALTEMKVDVVISVGHWPLVDLKRYREAVEPLKSGMLQANQDIIIGVGEVSAERLALLNGELLRAYASIDFTEMGREAYREMKALATGNQLRPVTYTATVVHSRK